MIPTERVGAPFPLRIVFGIDVALLPAALAGRVEKAMADMAMAKRMVIPSTPHYSNALVPVSRGSVVPGHGDLDIYIVGFHRRVKVPSVRSILYSTT